MAEIKVSLLLGPFALICALLRTYVCALLRFFAHICASLHPTAFRTTAFGNFRGSGGEQRWAKSFAMANVVGAERTETEAQNAKEQVAQNDQKHAKKHKNSDNSAWSQAHYRLGKIQIPWTPAKPRRALQNRP